jgi:hypothetical protein
MANFPLGGTVNIDNTEVETTGTITTSSTSIVATLGEASMVSVSISGTYAGVNATWEVSNDNSVWVATQALRTDTGAAATTTGVITSNATVAYHVACQGMRYMRIRSTAYTSGTANVKIRSIAVASPNIVTLGATASVTADTEITAAAASADSLANPTVGQVGAINSVFNGSSWDRQRGNSNVTVDSSSARTASGNGANGTNHNGRGMQFFLNVTAVSGTTPTMTVRLQYSFDGTTYMDADTTNLQTASISTTGLYRLMVYPGVTTVANLSKNDCLPRNWRAAWTIAGTTPSFTFTSTASYVA